MSVPPDFGRVSDDPALIGTPIANKSTVLAEVDRALGFDRPPKVEFVLVRPFVQLRIPFTRWGISYNTFGHAAVRYTLPSGEQVLMNIEGLKQQIVQFRDPTEYFYGTDAALTGDQKGVYNRSMITVQLRDVDDAAILRMHEFFLELQRKAAEGRAGFFIVPLPMRELLLRLRPDSLMQYGNCARWTSEGLKRAGLAKRTHWPKSMFIQLFENHPTAKVVSFRAVKTPHSALTAEPLELVSPLQTFRSLAYFDLERFASVVVEVAPEDTTARVTVRENPDPPSPWRNKLNSRELVLLSSLLTGGFLLRQSGALAAVRYLFRVRNTAPLTRETFDAARRVAEAARVERRVQRQARKQAAKQKRHDRVESMRRFVSKKK